MKLNLFLPVASFLVLLHLCKAGPLRLQKRAVFYIANETACVVDNIVYSNGDPIPTDDPCEACKCRPPGFACVLKQCNAKPGCKAIRRIGQCCPDYVCGCEHNGRMYKDGEEIRDPKNPCYKCHCQGSSIACAFVDCFFRDDCETFYHPGECCPTYKNCTRDTHEVNQFPGNNALPPVHLLPELNDESVLPGDLPSTAQKLTTEKQTSPTQSPTPSTIHDETPAPEVEEPSKASGETQTTASVSEVSENTKWDAEVADSSEEEVHSKDEDKKESDHEKESAEESEEPKTLFNSEIEISKPDSEHSEKVDPTQSSVERIKLEEPQTTISNKLGEPDAEEVTEKPLESEPIPTQVPESEKQVVKNSAADNGKSLKIQDEELDDLQKHEESKTDEPKEKLDETVTKPQSELSTETEPPISKEVTTQNKPEYEETQAKPQVQSFYSNNDKVKSESAETVTIVVHVREKAKPSTEDIKPEEPQTTVSTKLVESEGKPEKSPESDSVTEKVTTEPEISTTQKLLKSNDELKIKSIEVIEESIKDNVIATTDKTFEVFTTAKQLYKDESTTNSPSTEQPEGKVEERSGEKDPVSDVTEYSTSKEKVSEEKKDEDLLIEATTHSIVDETSQTGLQITDNDDAEIKTNEPMVTIIEIDPSREIKIKIISDSEETILKIKEETEKGSESQEVEEIKSDQNPETTDEVKTENIEEVNPEVREDEPTPEETSEEKRQDVEATSTQKHEETTPAKVRASTSSTEKPQEPVSTEKPKETASTEKPKEPVSTEKPEEPVSTEKPEEPVSTEKIKEAKSVDSTPETYKQTEETTEQPTTVGTTEAENNKHDETTETEKQKHDETTETVKHKHDETTEAEKDKHDETTETEKHTHDETTETGKHKHDESTETEKQENDETAETEKHKHDEKTELENHRNEK